MPEADVLYSDVKFTKSRDEANGTATHSDDTTYSEVKSAKTAKLPTPSTELPVPQQQVVSNGRSTNTSEKVAMAVLSVLLAVAVVALAYTTYKNVQTTEDLRKLTAKYEAVKKNLTERNCHANPIILNQSCYSDGKTCLKCETGWEKFETKCYNFSTKKFLWSQSRAECEHQGGHLVKIDSRNEQAFLELKLRDKMDNAEDKFWIGLTDAKDEGTWLWADGSPLNKSLTFWSGNEPDDWTGEDDDGEDCVRMGEKGGAKDLKNWFTKSCKIRHKHICERDADIGQTKCA
uniref:C-type lectin domain family 4 member E-like isoform X1 n=1 Tax=Semicossyphus pulcher TaxID=241346 RepID=UPI0037E81022